MAQSNVFLTTYLNHLTVERGLSTNTIAAYKRDLELYENYLKEKDIAIDAVDSEIVSGMVGWLRKRKLSEASIARSIVAIRNFHAFAAKDFSLPDPARGVLPPKIPKRLPKAISIAEITKLLESKNSSGSALRDRALLELLYASGGRVSEIVAMNVEDLQNMEFEIEPAMENQVLTMKVLGKGGKERLIPIGSFAQLAIMQYLTRLRPTYLKNHKERALFLNTQGKRLSRQSAWQIVQDAARAAGISEIVTPHSLRHSFATHLIDGGADIRVVQELLGHSSVTTTQIYTLVTIDKLRESYATAHPRSR